MPTFTMLLDTYDAIAITPEQMEPLLDSITGNIGVIMPFGIAVLGIMVGIGLIPRIIRMFT